MFRADILHASTFKEVMEALKDAFPDGKFICTKQGIFAHMMGPSHILFTSLHWHVSAFQHYTCTRDLALHFSITQMAKVLKLAAPNDYLSLSVPTNVPASKKKKTKRAEGGATTTTSTTSTTTVVEQEPDKLQLTITSMDGKKDIDVEFHLMDVEQDELDIPEHTFDCVVTLSSQRFRETISQLRDLGDVCEIRIEPNRVSFSTQNETNGRIDVHLNRDASVDSKQIDLVKIECAKTIKKAFTMNQLVHMCKAAMFSPQVQLKLSSDFPLCVHYEKEAVGYLTYYLAPKMENEGEEEE
jgi:proliferating cell nuclear antigen